MMAEPEKSLDPDQENCSRDRFYKKLKYSKVIGSSKNYINQFPNRKVQQQVLLDLTILQDIEKSLNQRNSTQILDFFGDIGGFIDFVMIVFGLIG